MKLTEIKETFVETTDGKRMVEGSTYIFIVGGKEFVGTYLGFAPRGMMEFESIVNKDKMSYKLFSIDKIFEVEIQMA